MLTGARKADADAPDRWCHLSGPAGGAQHVWKPVNFSLWRRNNFIRLAWLSAWRILLLPKIEPCLSGPLSLVNLGIGVGLYS